MNPRMKMRGYGGAAIVVLTVTVGYLMVQVPTLQDKANTAVVKADGLEPQVSALSDNQKKLISGLDEANRRLVALGKAPVAVPSVTPAPQPAGMTAAEVRLIVTQELADQHISITQAEVSQISKAVDTLKNQVPMQVKTAATLAVAAYCADARCQPKPTPGPAGSKGDKGDKGDAGKDAPKITDEQLLATVQAAIVSFCGQDSQPCKGKDGADGSVGPMGPQGPAGPTCPAGSDLQQRSVITKDEPLGVYAWVCVLSDK